MDLEKAARITSQTIVAGDLSELRRLLKAGANPTWGNYDHTTPLHTAAAEGNLAAVGGGGDMSRARTVGITAVMLRGLQAGCGPAPCGPPSWPPPRLQARQCW